MQRREDSDNTTVSTSLGAEVVVACAGLRKRFDDVQAVDGLTLEVRRGECFGLLGPNGAGKTTTIEMIEGLQQADGGSVAVLGTVWGKSAAGDHAIRQRIGVALQDTQLADKQTVFEVVHLFRSLYDRGRDPLQVLEWLDLMEKKDTRYHKLSGGQKQRVILACAFISDPDILFLDEPTTGLDPQARLQVWQVVRTYLASGGTVVVTTHYMEEAAQMCDRIAIMDAGRVIATGTPQELIDGLNASRIVEFTLETADADKFGVEEMAELRQGPSVEHVRRTGATFVLQVDSTKVAMQWVIGFLNARRLEPDNLSTHQATLDDVFLHLTGKALRDG